MKTKFYALSSAKGYKLINMYDILYCKASGNYTYIYLENSTNTLISKQLGHIQEALPEEAFVRIHHSYLVNLHHVDYYSKEDGGVLILKNGKKLKVSEGKKADLLAKLNIL